MTTHATPRRCKVEDMADARCHYCRLDFACASFRSPPRVISHAFPRSASRHAAAGHAPHAVQPPGFPAALLQAAAPASTDAQPAARVIAAPAAELSPMTLAATPAEFTVTTTPLPFRSMPSACQYFQLPRRFTSRHEHRSCRIMKVSRRICSIKMPKRHDSRRFRHYFRHGRHTFPADYARHASRH